MFRRAAVVEGRPVTETGRGARTSVARDGVGRERIVEEPRRRRRGAGAADAVGAGVLMIARLVRLVAGLLALTIAVGIALIALDATSTNSVVSTIHDAARSLVGPFDGIFKISSHKVEIAVNWGIALIVYLVVGAILAGLIERIGAGARSRAAVD